MTIFFVSDACVHQVLLINCDITNATYTWAWFQGLCLIFRGWLTEGKTPCYLYSGAWLDFLFSIFVCALLHHKHSHNKVIPSFLLCLNAKSRLCCTHFSYHCHKIRNVLCQLKQITKRQRDPWRLHYNSLWLKMFLKFDKKACEYASLHSSLFLWWNCPEICGEAGGQTFFF